ncbi:MAG TPA: cob(I)yrinic acid a,c-diamide adenosyltransferase [Lachnospiraceae bacterium]|nr:cob(I)yrinic acid a,c-diamide adenosyltransferase [Lachnospiraceae bacterium]
MTGLTHLYCGDGKGKTTTAIGLAVRAAGSGMNVAFVQFMKGCETSEIDMLKLLPNICVFRSDVNFGFFSTMKEEEKNRLTKIHNSLIDEALKYLGSEGMLVLDEITHAINFDLINCEKLKDFIEKKPQLIELVMTGRNPQAYLIEAADYVSEIKKIKHPYDRGITARKGIEL